MQPMTHGLWAADGKFLAVTVAELSYGEIIRLKLEEEFILVVNDPAPHLPWPVWGVGYVTDHPGLGWRPSTLLVATAASKPLAESTAAALNDAFRVVTDTLAVTGSEFSAAPFPLPETRQGEGE